MQAIGFLSRREHSRQELRRKLLDALRRRAREDAALQAAAEELARAVLEQPSNGIDDAFTPRAAAAAPAVAVRALAPTGDGARASRAGADEAGLGPRPRLGAASAWTSASPSPSPTRPAGSALDALSLASGSPLPPALRSRIAAAALDAGSGPRSDTDHDATRDTDHRADHAEHADHDHDPANDAHSEPDGADPEAEVDRLLDWLVANKYLSDARFVESRVSARSRKQGTLRIRMELSRHGLALEPEQAATLRETEFARARDLWQRRFGEVSGDPRQRAKQARFLAARGFAADVVRRIVGGLDEE